MDAIHKALLVADLIQVVALVYIAMIVTWLLARPS